MNVIAGGQVVSDLDGRRGPFADFPSVHVQADRMAVVAADDVVPLAVPQSGTGVRRLDLGGAVGDVET